MKNLKKNISLLVVAVMIIAIGVLIYDPWRVTNSEIESYAKLDQSGLLEVSSNVFPGLVIQKIGEINTSNGKSTQYKVQVVRQDLGLPSKGSVADEVIVNKIDSTPDYQPSKETGSSRPYNVNVFYTKYDPIHHWYTVLSIASATFDYPQR